jgi:hypothetical protein
MAIRRYFGMLVPGWARPTGPLWRAILSSTQRPRRRPRLACLTPWVIVFFALAGTNCLVILVSTAVSETMDEPVHVSQVESLSLLSFSARSVGNEQL